MRVTDIDAGTDGLYVDRCINMLHQSGSQITVLVQTYLNAVGITAGNSYTLGLNRVTLSDEWQSIAPQYETFRIRAARFDVYDLAPAVIGPVAFGTFHDKLNTDPNWTFDQVTDSVDSKLVPNGGKSTFYWVAKGTEELGFQGTSTNTPVPYTYGGLRVAFPPNQAGKQYQVMCKFLVDFRGRV